MLSGTYTVDYDILAADVEVRAELESRPALLEAYTAKAAPYLEWYPKMCTPRTVRFGASAAPTHDKYLGMRLELIRRYLNMVSQFVHVNVLLLTEKNMNCPTCGAALDETMTYEGVQVCTGCKTERVYFGKGRSAGSAAEDSTPGRTYRTDNEERDNFIKALMRYQGLQKEKLPADIYKNLDHYFTVNNYPTGTDVRAGCTVAPLVLNKDLMYKALASIGCPMYDHINLICYTYWGTQLPDVQHLQDTIILHFDITQRVARLLGIQSVNTQYRLFKHLEMVGYACHAVDFRIPKTREIVQADDDRWRGMCEGVEEHERKLGIRFIPTI